MPKFRWIFGLALLITIAGCVSTNSARTGTDGQSTGSPPGSSAREDRPAIVTPESSPTTSISGRIVTKSPSSANFTPTPFTQAPTPKPPLQICTPLQGHSLSDLHEIITNPFDPPPPGKDTGHHGIDFAYYRRGDRLSILGVPIQSVLPGRVAAVVMDRIPYGNMVIVETPYAELPPVLISMLGVPADSSIYLLYAHMNQAPRPGAGEVVACGQTLGEVGNTPKGWSSDPHLHLEGRIGPSGVTFSSMAFYDTGATEQEMANYQRWRISGEFRLFDPMCILNWGLNP